MLLPSFLLFPNSTGNNTNQSSSPVEDPPSYSPAHPYTLQGSELSEETITASTTPQASWSRSQCIAWLTAFLTEKCELPRQKAEKAEGKFKECGVVMFRMERREWEKLVKHGGWSVWAKIEETKTEEAKRNNTITSKATRYRALHFVNLASQNDGVGRTGLGGNSQPYMGSKEPELNSSLTVRQQIKILEDEKKTLEADKAEEDWQKDLAHHERNQAWSNWGGGRTTPEDQTLAKMYYEKKKIAQEWDASYDRRRLRIQRIRLDIIALRRNM